MITYFFFPAFKAVRTCAQMCLNYIYFHKRCPVENMFLFEANDGVMPQGSLNCPNDLYLL